MAPRPRRALVGGVQPRRPRDRLLPAVRRGRAAGLDVACGTGRLLVPYLRGLDVEGCDVSSDMLALCRERAEREGLAPPQLYAQAVHELDLLAATGRSSSAAASGSAASATTTSKGCGDCTSTSSREEARPRQRGPVRGHALWPRWTRGAAALPRPWREPRERRVGSRRRRVRAADAARRARPSVTAPTPSRCARGCGVTASSSPRRSTRSSESYFTHELRLLLERAGFVDVELRAGYEDWPPTSDDDFVVFVARKS